MHTGTALRTSTRRGHAHRRGSARVPQLWHPDVPGPLWNGTRQVPLSQIAAYCRVLAREFRPHKIILFGSYASGSATPESDVDLVVVLPYDGSHTDKVVEIRGRVEAPFPLDLLVWKPDEAARVDTFTRTVLGKGRIMYEAQQL